MLHLSPIRAFSLGAVALLAACAGPPETLAPSQDIGSTPASIAEGELWICKAGNAAETFTFSYSMVSDAGPAGPSGTVSVAAGSCELAVALDKTVSGPTNRYRAVVTEGALPANWSLASIGVGYTSGFNNTPVYDLPNQKVSNIRFANDLGATVTFTNTYTPPPPTGKLGDFVWYDIDGNGIQDSGEPGIAGVTVTLGGDASATTTTDANGAYLFTGLAAGSYTVTAGTPAGYTPSPSNQGSDPATDSNGSPASATLATYSSEDLTLDFGFVAIPVTGCTYTQGYWKTHSEFGPAPYDPTWAQLANGASTAFFLSGGTWYSVFHTAPAGNVYYSLAHQYMAAKLSILAGAAPTAVAATITAAEALLNTYTPAQVRAMKGSNPVRQQFTALAETLDRYNNGLTGPGHCG